MFMSYCDLIPLILYPISTVKMTCNDDNVYCYLLNVHSIGKNHQQIKQKSHVTSINVHVYRYLEFVG